MRGTLHHGEVPSPARARRRLGRAHSSVHRGHPLGARVPMVRLVSLTLVPIPTVAGPRCQPAEGPCPVPPPSLGYVEHR